jgi:TPR repeat protein
MANSYCCSSKLTLGLRSVAFVATAMVSSITFAQVIERNQRQCDVQVFQKILREAQSGLPDAQFALGVDYDVGLCVEKDPTRAAKLYGFAAVSGNIPAKHNLANLYLNGIGVNRDSDKAIRLLKENAMEKYPRSMNALGLIYLAGDVAKRDVKQGLALLRDAANLGSDDASFNLGEINEFGREEQPINYSAALQWYLKAANQGVVAAAQRVCEMYRRGRGVKQDFHEAQLWCRQAAEQGNVMAQNVAGALAYGGHPGAEVDYAEAVKWWNRAAEQGNPDAQFFLGMAYELGRGVPKDLSKSKQWFEIAAKHGQPEAMRRLAREQK